MSPTMGTVKFPSCSAHFIADASILQRWEQHELFGTRGPLLPYIADIVDYSSTLASAAHMSPTMGTVKFFVLLGPLHRRCEHLQRWEQHEPFGTRGPLLPYIADVRVIGLTPNPRPARPTCLPRWEPSSSSSCSAHFIADASIFQRWEQREPFGTRGPLLQPQAVWRPSLDAARHSLRAALLLQPRAATRVLRQARPKDASSSASAAHVDRRCD